MLPILSFSYKLTVKETNEASLSGKNYRNNYIRNVMLFLKHASDILINFLQKRLILLLNY